MKSLLKKYLFPLLFSLTLFSQTVPSGTISGTIRDADTGDPLYFVNIFLANTTLGTASDEDGYYKIENIPPGNYDIVFSHIGYEVQIIPVKITFDEYIIENMNIRLKSKVLNGEKITIETEVPREWRKNLERFMRIFIGETGNALKCTIKNPEVIDLQVDPETNVLTASSESMIKIENQALGYDIEIILVEFEWETDDKGLYTIYPYFKEMVPENDKAYQKWLNNRYETYRGSLQHFLSSLVLDRIEENKFYLYRPRFIGRTYWMSEHIEPDSIQSTLIDSTYYIKRIIYNGYLLVNYDDVLDQYKSSLEFKNQYVDIDSFGYNITSYSLKTGGYWATLRIADTLPRNYRPPK